MSTGTNPILAAIRSFRSNRFQYDNDGGIEIVDALAAGLGDKDIGNALAELADLADHIYGETVPAIEDKTRAEGRVDGLREAIGLCEGVAADCRKSSIGGGTNKAYGATRCALAIAKRGET